MYRDCVEQYDSNGCFVAAVANILKIPYYAAKTRLGFKLDECPGRTPEDALARLRRVSITTKPVRVRKLEGTRKKLLVLIRWACCPSAMHAAVWDGTRILDGMYPMPLREYERQIDSVYEVLNA